ncbi:MAG: monovalent cation/H(+) antiporter subunit G [Schwartzia sp.]|nr:monovalent cation/H(+) antiporter subunit G [Schwartzia sp. (in: firmicutes)]
MISCSLLQEMIAVSLMGVGLIFLIGSMVGMLRLPDFYSRVHASGNSETLGTMLIFLGLAVYNGISITSAKLLIILMFIFVGNPIGSHILAKTAYKTGHPVWTKNRLPDDEILSAGKEGGGETDADIHS